MKAFHTNWSKVFAVKHPNTPYQVEDFELLTTMLSALEWRKHNGSIRMVTDNTGYEYYKKLGLLWLWDDGVDNVLDHLIPANVNPHVFWAAAKLYALTYQPAPVVMMDTDFIVWNHLGNRISAYPLSVIHREEINPTVYPQKLFLKADDDYVWPDLDWDIAPCNTAFVCFHDPAFLAQYTQTAIDFMEHCSQADDPLIYMVFAEQRMISMCAKQTGTPIHELDNLAHLFGNRQTDFTHTWGFKQQMRDNPRRREQFCKRCAVRLVLDFPESLETLQKIPELAKYL